MAAALTVCTTYELAENIISHLPSVYIYRAAQVSHLWRTVIAESTAVRKLSAPLKPLRQRDITLLDGREDFGIPPGSLQWQICKGDFGPVCRAEFIVSDARYVHTCSSFPRRPVSILTRHLTALPHYSKAVDFNLVIDLEAAKQREPLGQVVRMFLPPIGMAGDCFGKLAGQLVSDPPVTAIRIDIGEGDAIISCTAWSPKGISLGDLVAGQVALLRTERVYGCEPRVNEAFCVASLTVNMAVDELRSADMEEFKLERAKKPKGRIDAEHAPTSEETKQDALAELAKLGRSLSAEYEQAGPKTWS